MKMEKENNKDIYYKIGRNIRKLRMEKGMKQRELADALFLSDSFIAKLESVTHQTIAIDTLEQFAKVLEVDIKDFFNEID